jgi:hypothetical protein
LVTRHEFLEGVHRLYQPRTYLEVGIRTGASLGLSRVPSIAIDPDFEITTALHCDVEVVKATSDDFFAGAEPLRHLPQGRIDLGFIDGMHLLEFALRDFINVERHADWTSVIVIDDALPRNVTEASRDRVSAAWTGDVFKIATVLREHRPDLLVLAVDSEPTGVLCVFGADPDSTVLRDRYDEIIREQVRPDPQWVPESVLARTESVDGDALLAGDFWAELRDARESRTPRHQGLDDLRAAVQRATRPGVPREISPGMLVHRASRPRATAKSKTARTHGLAPRHTLPEHLVASITQRLRRLRRRLRRPR